MNVVFRKPFAELPIEIIKSRIIGGATVFRLFLLPQFLRGNDRSRSFGQGVEVITGRLKALVGQVLLIAGQPLFSFLEAIDLID